MKVVSLALFRHANSLYEKPEAGPRRGLFYTNYLPAAIRAYLMVYAGWELRIHHDGTPLESEYGPTLQALADDGLLRLVHMGRAERLCESMLWRMAPLGDPDVEAFVCRDIDSLPSPREFQAVSEFLRSSASLHCINDSTSHATPMLGGMIGVKRAAFCEELGIKDLEGLLALGGGMDLDTHGTDQSLLNSRVWPRMKSSAFCHRFQGLSSVGAAREASCVGDYSAGPLGPLDTICPHIGAPYCVQKALRFFRGYGSHPLLDRIVEFEGGPVVHDRYVVLSSNRSHDYEFYLPLTSLLWQQIGYQPLCLLVGEEREWRSSPRSAMVLEELKRRGARMEFLSVPEGHRDSTVAQVCRLYAGDVLGNEDAYLITGDVDMWPLDRDWYEPRDQWGKPTLWYANVYGGTRWPLCYVGMTVRLWRQVMGHGEINKRIREQLDGGLGGDTDPWKAWNYDEDLFAIRFKEWGGKFVGVDRAGGPPADRIDRSCWPTEVSVVGKVDAHLLRPGWSGSNWQGIRPILEQLCNDTELAWADDYRKRYMEMT